MKNLFTTGLLLLALVGYTFAQDAADVMVEEPSATEGPQIEFESKTLDYGTIEHNSDGNREFKFTNVGTEDLVIQNCKGSCGCTVPQCPREAYAPGTDGVIKVKYATDRLGPFTKFVTVNSNDANEPSIRLTIKGTVLTVEEYAKFSKGAEGAKDTEGVKATEKGGN